MNDVIVELSKVINNEIPVYIRHGNVCNVIALNDRTVIEDADLSESTSVINTVFLLELVQKYKNAYEEDQKNNNGPS